MEKIRQRSAYLSAQIKAGAQAVQIFDSWAGILAPYDYKKFAFPHVKTAIKALKKVDVPVIYFVNDCAGMLERGQEVRALMSSA